MPHADLNVHVASMYFDPPPPTAPPTANMFHREHVPDWLLRGLGTNISISAPGELILMHQY